MRSSSTPIFGARWRASLAGRRAAAVVALVLWGLPSIWSPAWAGAGAETYNEMLETGAIYDDEEWQSYLTEVGERVLAVTPHKDRTYTFVLLDDTMVNAFTTGDGYIFLTRGIMAYFTTEDELAAVLGHEIGHVVGRHVASNKGRNVMTQVLGWLGVIATNSMAMKDLADTLAAAAGADYGRKEELEADAFSADWLVKAGYNPQAAVDMIQLLRDDDLFQTNVVGRPNRYHGIFRSHPEHRKRIHELVQIVDYEVPTELRPPERDFMEMLDGMVFGDDAASGVVKENIYYHSSQRIVVEFPKGWEVGNSRTEVMGRAPKTSDPYITVQPQKAPTQKQTPAEYVTETLKRDDVSNGEEFNIGEFPAFIGDVAVLSGNTAKRKIAIIFKDNVVYLFKGEVGEKGDVEQFEAHFKQVVMSFRAMTAADLKAANARRIEVVEAKPGDTFAKFAQGAPIAQHGEGMLRVINGKHPYGEPRAGDMVKIIR